MSGLLGFNGSKKEVLRIWKKNSEHWGAVGSPWRPSLSDLSGYRQLISSSFPRAKILILGATPELRDLAAQCGGERTVVDISLPMLMTMGSRTNVSKIDDEIIVKSEWCSAPLRENYFDLIIGDMVWWVISVETQRRLASKMARWLRSDGMFVARFRLRDPLTKKEDGLATVSRYADLFIKNPEKETIIANSLVSYLHDITADEKRKRLNRGATLEILRAAQNLEKNETRSAFIFEASKYLLSADWTSQTRKEIFDTLEDCFKLIGESRASDYDSANYPILAFHVKK